MKFSIGEFSKITSLSIKSLRLYHEKGILIPAEVDEFTGYRYYNEANYDMAKSIKIFINFIIVVFPETFGPIIPVMYPAGIVNETLLRVKPL